MTAIFGAPARAHPYATLAQLLQLPGKPGKASDNARSSFDAQAEGWVKLKLPRFRGVLRDLVQVGSAVAASLAAS